jgi:hypothetical protein
MKTWKLALCLAAIFLAGGLSGGLVVGKLVERRMAAFRAGPPGGALAARWKEYLKQRLGLTPDQERQIAPVLTGAADGFVQKVTDEMLASLDATNARVLPLLTPAQREKFLQMGREQEQMIRRLAQGRPPSPSPSGP